MKKFVTLLTLLLAPALVLGASQQFKPQITPPMAKSAGVINETPNRWFVEFASKPAVEGTAQKTLNQETVSEWESWTGMRFPGSGEEGWVEIQGAICFW